MVKAAVPLCPSLDAVIVTLAAARTWIIALEDAVATAVLELCHVTARPERTAPLPSRRVALACVLSPAIREEAANATDTAATCTTAAVTAIETPALTPSDVACRTTSPGATPKIKPESSMLAINTLELCHLIGRSARAAPFASRAVPIAR